jgi:serine/threonine-protein kinase
MDSNNAPHSAGAPALKPLTATIGYGDSVVGATVVDAPIVASDVAQRGVLTVAEVAETQGAEAVSPHGSNQTVSRTQPARSVVLPRKTKTSQGDANVDWNNDDKPRYEPIKALGEGGMGEVVLVQDQDIQRKVAVKKLKDESKSPAALLRFAEEVQVIGALEHPGIVPVHDVGIDESGQHYLVMKYVEGETLETVIEKLKAGSAEHVRRFSYEYRSKIFMKLLEAIRYAHSHAIVHRDIKPANIMVGPFGEVTIMDWGIAKRIGTKS